MPVTILPLSHTDHAMTEAQRAFVLDSLRDRDGFFIAVVELPEDLGTVPCALYGPLMGDAPVTEGEVRYAMRGTRPYLSRMVDRPVRQVRTVTVIAGPANGATCALYTMYGGKPAVREPEDKSLRTAAERDEARVFWSQHALAFE